MMNLPPLRRLDEELVRRALCDTRSRARDAIIRGTVAIDGEIVAKPARKVSADQMITLDDPAQGYVSRAALKLIAGLDASGIDPSGASGLDIGASTGGFTQVLLERGASDVVALDVGHGQMHERVRRDCRVTALEGLNARELDETHLANIKPTLLVSDVSFISLRLALPPALRLAAPGAQCVLLVKPQFEVGRAHIGKNGIVAHDQAQACAEALYLWLNEQAQWQSDGLAPSPITGSDGNHEFLLWGRKA